MGIIQALIDERSIAIIYFFMGTYTHSYSIYGIFTYLLYSKIMTTLNFK